MLLENYIKLLLEAPQIKLGDLMKHPGKVLVGKNYQSYWEFSNVEFKSFHDNEDLSKRGPFFNCMKLCFDEFLSYENDPEFDVAENLLAMIVYINGLYDFKNNPEVNKVYTKFIADGYNGFEELRTAYENIFQHIGPKNLNSFGNPTYLNLLKTSQTEYLFDTPDRTMNDVLAVVPTTTASSIFWARTNATGQQILLTKLDRTQYRDDADFITWCTSFPDESNMFHSYYVNGGTSLFYFLPINDVKGLNKFCIGITKIRDPRNPDEFRLICGGHTTVGFENRAFIEDGSDFQDEYIKRAMLNKFGPLGLTAEMLEIIEEKVSGRNPFDKYAYVGNLRPAEFAASINMNTIGATEDGRNTIKRQIETILSTYEDPEFLKDYQPNSKIIQIINKDIRYWTECNVDIKLIPEKFAASSDFWVNNTIKNSEEDVSYSQCGKSIQDFIDWNFKKRPNLLTPDFIIEFIENCFDKAVQEGLYNPDDSNTRYDRYTQISDENGQSEAYYQEYRQPYDKMVLNLKMSLVPVEALMTWSSPDLVKFFQYIQKVKSNYPSDVIETNNMYKNDNEVNDYFIRRISKKVNEDEDDEDDYNYSNAEYRKIKIFSAQLLKALFKNFDDFKNFCDSEGRAEIKGGRGSQSMFYITDFLLFDNAKYLRYKPFLIPISWMTPEVIKKHILLSDDKNINNYLSRSNQVLDILLQDSGSSDVMIQDLNQFKKDNLPILTKVISSVLKTELEEIFNDYEETGDASQVLHSRSLSFLENILNKHADIIQELQATDLKDPNSDFAKFTNLYERVNQLRNRGLSDSVSDNFNDFITKAAQHCRHLIDNEPKEVGEFTIKFLDKLRKRLGNNSGSLSNFKNSLFMATEFKKNNTMILNFGQFYFWNCNISTIDTVVRDPHDWASFFYEIYEGNPSFSLFNISSGYYFQIENAINALARIKTGAASIQDIERKMVSPDNLRSFINCEMFRSIMNDFTNLTDDEDEEFFTVMMQKLYYDYFNSDMNRFVNFCLVFFKDNPYNNLNKYLNILTEKFLDSKSEDESSLILFKKSNIQKGVDETTKYREEKRRIARDELLEKKRAERLARGEDDDDYYDDDDDNLDEAIKFKIGQKILTENQLRHLIRHLL